MHQYFDQSSLSNQLFLHSIIISGKPTFHRSGHTVRPRFIVFQFGRRGSRNQTEYAIHHRQVRHAVTFGLLSVGTRYRFQAHLGGQSRHSGQTCVDRELGTISQGSRNTLFNGTFKMTGTFEY